MLKSPATQRCILAIKDMNFKVTEDGFVLLVSGAVDNPRVHEVRACFRSVEGRLSYMVLLLFTIVACVDGTEWRDS